MIYTTQDGDMLDAICHRHYGQGNVALSFVLDANPGISAYGPTLPRGISIHLPVLPNQEKKKVIQLWD